ncbi:MAG: right-handed parallel beta-helix repeat-containing protein [Bryobacteraceae bacterium]|nr:right-handed parallel beta-helix repeat-containing protein [Bryobacteraceae bacterium]MDW8378430.1 right-handed parallel beta-helix repeat-containing protein [Bryobacterales bacterium]
MKAGLVSVLWVAQAGSLWGMADWGPRNEPLQPPPSAGDLYVVSGARLGTGTREKPFGDIGEAVQAAAGKPGRTVRILVAGGHYRAVNLPLREGVSLWGGFQAGTWSRDIFQHRTVLDAFGQGRVFGCADGAVVDGVTVRGGRVRGLGGALLCEGQSPVLRNNVWEANETLGPEPWKPRFLHEDANDGGALACRKGCRAVIEGNLFYRNRTENGRGGAVAITQAAPRLERNVFLENDAGLADPMRSSDGGAVSVYDHADPLIRHNAFVSNRALNKNDGGGLFVALWAAPRIEGNVFVNNYADDDAGALFVGGQKHHYDTPFDPMPPASKYQVLILGNRFSGNRNASFNSGAFRITMESRVTFANNVVAENSGAYFQRSELTVAHNTFLDAVLLTETKQGLAAPVLVNNIFWKTLRWDVEARIEANLSRSDLGPANLRGDAAFTPDGAMVMARRARYRTAEYVTEIQLEPGLAKGEWVGRPVQAGDQWTVVREVRPQGFTVWGNHSRLRSFRIEPSYAIRKESAAVDRAVEALGVETDIRGASRRNGRADVGAYEWGDQR